MKENEAAKRKVIGGIFPNQQEAKQSALEHIPSHEDYDILPRTRVKRRGHMKVVGTHGFYWKRSSQEAK